MAVDWGTIASLATAGGTLVLAVSGLVSVAHHWNLDRLDPR